MTTAIDFEGTQGSLRVAAAAGNDMGES